MFQSIATRYDLANHCLSCGVDFYWRKRAAEIVAGWSPRRILDLATGTGDLALTMQRKVPHAEIIGADFVPEMIARARAKGVRHGMVEDAMNLSFEDGSFDCVTIAFGLRNLPDFGAGLREMARVLRRDGHVLVLEFSIPALPVLRPAYRFYLHRCMPAIGSVLTGKKAAYQYLGDSIEDFPSGRDLVALLESNGFKTAAFQRLTGGIVTIYTAAKA